MAKRKTQKVVDLAPKGEKLTKEELTALQALARDFEAHYRELGVLDFRKHTLNHAVQELQKAMEKMQFELKGTYGDVDIDITTGEIKEISNETNS
tara:strand:+ start:375 stop:659 length:285 start_codon:yes stop_codon:yes gene_type:complete